MFCRAYCVVTGESGYRSQYTPYVREDEGMDDQVTFRLENACCLTPKSFPKIVTRRDGTEQVG